LETHVIPQDLENQKCAVCRQIEVDAVLGLSGPILERYQDHGQKTSTARYCAMPE